MKWLYLWVWSVGGAGWGAGGWGDEREETAREKRTVQQTARRGTGRVQGTIILKTQTGIMNFDVTYEHFLLVTYRQEDYRGISLALIYQSSGKCCVVLWWEKSDVRCEHSQCISKSLKQNSPGGQNFPTHQGSKLSTLMNIENVLLSSSKSKPDVLSLSLHTLDMQRNWKYVSRHPTVKNRCTT